MPEGPEIRREADRIAKVLVGKKIAQAQFSFPRLRRFEKRLNDTKVTAVDTRGKAILTCFSNGLTLYSHNQLYGRWHITKRDQIPETGRSLRVALHTATHSALLYSASDVAVLNARQLERHRFLSRVGPDILDPDLNSGNIFTRLDDPLFRRRATGSLYLDQSFLAGIGNYLRSEILHRAGVHPANRPIDLESARRKRLAQETLVISRRSYRTRGVTMTRERARKLKSSGLSYAQYRFWVFGRDGLPCYGCGTPIMQLSVSGRRLFLCPSCQAK
jgi:endonuclease-8